MFFRNFLMILASLALCTGCDTDPVGSQDTSSVQADSSGSPDTATIAGWEDVKLASGEFGSGYVSIQAQTPDGKPATFYVCNTISGCEEVNGKITNPKWTFKDVTNFELHTDANFKGDDFHVYAERENYLFVPLQFTAKGDKANPKKPVEYVLEWKDPGSWGLAPNGVYIDSFDSGKQTSITTSVKNGKVTLTYNNSGGIVTHDAFLPDDQNPNKKISGKILVDLSELQLKASFPNLPEKNFETTLTIVK